MNNLRLLAPCALALVFIALNCQAKSWRGIVPLHSTRTDVQRLLGQPNSRYERYAFDNEEAQITYSGDVCASSWNVPAGTVIEIGVTYNNNIKLFDLNIDLTKYEIFNDPLVTSHTYYINRDEGIRYEVFNGNGYNKGLILEAYYGPTSEDEKLLRCPQKGVKHDTKLCPIHTCPLILVRRAQGEFNGTELTFGASIAGACPGRRPSYKWSVSSGQIEKGQGTATISVGIPQSVKVPITVSVEIGNAIPDSCPRISSYTIRDRGVP